MADQQTRVSFSAVDNGVSSFISKVRADSQRLGQDLLKDAREYSSNSREQIKFLERQIELISKRNQLETQERRAQISARRAAGARDEDLRAQTAIASRDAQAANVQSSYLKQILDQLKEDTGYQPEQERSFFNSLLKFSVFQRTLQLTGAIPGARTELDLLQPLLGVTGAVAGGLAGGIAETALGAKVAGFGLGEADLGIIGAEIGRQAGEVFGEGVSRTLELRSERDRAQFALRGITGSTRELSDLSSLGLSRIATAQIAQQVVDATGRASNLSNRVEDFIAIQRAFGITEQQASQQFSLERLGAGPSGQRIANLFEIGRTQGLFRGGDQTIFRELIASQSQLVEQLAQTSEAPSATAAARLALEFNRVGGSFSIQDPRSISRISGIGQSIANPNGPFAQAFIFNAIRRAGRGGGGLFDLIEAQQTALEDPRILQQILTQATSGVSEQQGLLNLQGLFGGQLPASAIRRLFERRNEVGAISNEELSRITGDVESVRGRARQNVVDLDISAARIENAFIEGVTQGLGEVTTLIGERFGQAAIDYVENRTRELFNQFTSSYSGQIPVNKTYIPSNKSGN